MCLVIDARGITVTLKINDYQPSVDEGWESQWCRCDHSFCSGDWLHYSRENDEILLSREVEELADKLTGLLNGELPEITELRCMEPDYVFRLHPGRDLRQDPRYTYIQPGYEFADIYVEWQVFFWYEGLTDNFLTVTLGREEIVQLRDYLSSVIN